MGWRWRLEVEKKRKIQTGSLYFLAGCLSQCPPTPGKWVRVYHIFFSGLWWPSRSAVFNCISTKSCTLKLSLSHQIPVLDLWAYFAAGNAGLLPGPFVLSHGDVFNSPPPEINMGLGLETVLMISGAFASPCSFAVLPRLSWFLNFFLPLSLQNIVPSHS